MSTAQPAETTPLLNVTGISKTFTDSKKPVPALRGLSFVVAEGEFVCLLGPSGSGKSTLLRIAGGLLTPDQGTVHFAGRPLHAPQREIGFVFQTTNLMPWRTVLENVLLPLEVQQPTVTDADRAQACELLALVGLAGFEHAYPKQLSGGMSQRVVLARTLIHKPQLLLMDEPFGALDALTRERLNLELLRIHSLQAKTVLMVTHSIPEAVLLADRIIVLSDRPARITAEVTIDLPRPRRIEDMSTIRFNALAMEVRAHIGQLTPGADQPLNPTLTSI